MQPVGPSSGPPHRHKRSPGGPQSAGVCELEDLPQKISSEDQKHCHIRYGAVYGLCLHVGLCNIFLTRILFTYMNSRPMIWSVDVKSTIHPGRTSSLSTIHPLVGPDKYMYITLTSGSCGHAGFLHQETCYIVEASCLNLEKCALLDFVIMHCNMM